MGKASRTKRERREQDGNGRPGSSLTPGAARAAGKAADERKLPVFWIVIALMIVAGIIAIVVTAPGESTKQAVNDAADAPVYGEIEVDGEELPTFTTPEGDDAVGEAVPQITGRNINNESTQLLTTGEPTVIVTVAHWCPHCNAEVPRIVDWAEQAGVDDGVNVIALSTAASKGQPNYPPAEWLAEEGWPFEVIFDDEADSASEALGVRGYPFITFVDGEGNVTERFSGEMPIDEFDAAVKRLQKG